MENGCLVNRAIFEGSPSQLIIKEPDMKEEEEAGGRYRAHSMRYFHERAA